MHINDRQKNHSKLPPPLRYTELFTIGQAARPKTMTVLTEEADIRIWWRQGDSRIVTRKYKSVPLQAGSGPEGSRKLRFPHYMTTAQEEGG